MAVAAALDSVITEKGTTLKIYLCRDIISGKLQSFFVLIEFFFCFGPAVWK